MTYQQHPLSAAFPKMEADEYQSLLDSVSVVGVLNPIVLYEGMVIDGWHRYQAAMECAATFKSVELTDTDPQDFVIAQNKARRNLTASQRAAAVAAVYLWHPARRRTVLENTDKAAPGATLLEVSENQIKSNKELADIAGVSERTIRQAKVVQSSGVEAVKKAVQDGAVSLKVAAEIAKKSKDEQDEIAAAGPEAMKSILTKKEDYLVPDKDEIEQALAEEAAEIEAMRLLLESDEPLKEITEKYKQSLMIIERLNARIIGLQNESQHQISEIKRLKSIIEAKNGKA